VVYVCVSLVITLYNQLFPTAYVIYRRMGGGMIVNYKLRRRRGLF
jgi:hypothetical protein